MLDRELARVDLCEEQQIADEMEEPLRVSIDDAEEPLLLRREIAPLLHQKLEVTADRREWRSQLVRNERDELILHQVELPEPCVLLGQEPLDRLGLGASRLLGLEEFLPLSGLFAEAPVS